MKKQGPCRHCGATSTPLWRNGPPDKPVLCNACGSRWRTKGSLLNYLPLHTREFPCTEDSKVPKLKSISFKTNEQKLHNKRHSNAGLEFKKEMPYCGQNFPKVLEEDISNRSSSGSAISYSESCAHFGTIDANELTASAQSNTFDTMPSRKRTCAARPKPSPVEKLRKELCTILHEQQSSNISGTSDDDLIYGSETLMDSVEIGHGGILIRLANSKNAEEESEASSFPRDGKSSIVNEAYSGSTSFLVRSESKATKNPNASTEKVKKSTTVQDHVKRDKSSDENVHILQDKHSPLTSIDLKEVINFDVFMALLSHEEQQQLMKYLPSVDIAKSAKSFRNFFCGAQFMESFSDFQQLLLEGVFDLSLVGEENMEYRTLRRLVLLNSTKSRWVGHHQKLKDVKLKEQASENKLDTLPKIQKQSAMPPLKGPLDSENQKLTELNGTLRSPKRSSKSGGMNLPSKSSLLKPTDAGSRSMYATDDFPDYEEASFSPGGIFSFHPESSSMLASLQFADETSNQDLLLDMPSNTAFPQAELLFSPSIKRGVTSSKPAESGISLKEDSLSNNPWSIFSSQQTRLR